MKHNGLEDADIMSVYKRLAEKHRKTEERKKYFSMLDIEFLRCWCDACCAKFLSSELVRS